MIPATRIVAGFVVCCLLFVMHPSVSGQVSQGGVPRSVRLSMAPDSRSWVVLNPPELEPLRREDSLVPVPYRFAVNLPADIDFSTNGSWTTAMDGSRVWRLTISATGALAMTLYFDRFRLPDGGKLFVYNPGRTQLLGAFTSLNNNTMNTFATSLIMGDQLTLEYNDLGNLTPPDLHISEVAYAYRGVSDPRLKTGFGSAGVCEVNVNCSEGAGSVLQEKGVTRIEVKRGGSTLWCSGSVLNNTRNDGTPYVLTADHCGKLSTADDLSKWIFYFNYQSATCPNPPVEPAHTSLTGAKLKAHAGENGSDFFLVLLNQPIPESYQAYFNGWSRENIASPSGVGIHHPQGDIKKISTYTQPLITSSWSGYSHPSHWRVSWAGTANGHGVTEGGSSGSPIFDNNGLLVGTLTGGDSMCDSSSLTLPDYYGKFSYHWDKNGTDSASVLKYWLDPDSTGVLKISGRSVGLTAINPESRITVFPNPVDKAVCIRWAGAATSVKAELRDIRGKILLMRVINVGESDTFSLDVSGFAPGLYLLGFTEGERHVVTKIIKN